jgi:hypothetical protein
MPDETPRREGGDDALAETDPADGRADEKVIVNQHRESGAAGAQGGPVSRNSNDISNDEDTTDHTEITEES